MQNYQEVIFFHYILENISFLNSTKSEFFSNPIIKNLFDIAKEHTLKYKEPPSKDQICQLVKLKGLEDKISDDIITSVYNTKIQLEQYDHKWLEENVGPWITLRNFENVIRKVISFIKTSSIIPENTLEIVEKARNMISSETALDFGFNLGSDFFDANSHIQTRLERTPSGYSYIDTCLKGGYWAGSLIMFLGAPKCGKSLWLQNLAAQSILLGNNTAYITLELQEELVNMRIGSNMLNLEMDTYDETAKDIDLMKIKLNSLKQNSFRSLGNLHVKEFPMSTLSTNDLESYLFKAEEILGYKFRNVFIDYLNIMKNWRNPNTENLYTKIKQIIEDLRASAQEGKWNFISATQVKISGWETSDLDITKVSESSALLHTVDGLFGIITHAEMKARKEYYLKYLADRVSGYENTRKRFIVNWKYARIEEDMNSQIEDMDFIMNSVVGGHGSKRRGTFSPQTQIAVAISSGILENPIRVSGEGLF